MLREVAGWEVAGGVAVQLKMQRARARMQTDELMVTHYEDIGRDLQWVVRGGGDDAVLYLSIIWSTSEPRLMAMW